jgi:hypothetical protein
MPPDAISQRRPDQRKVRPAPGSAWKLSQSACARSSSRKAGTLDTAKAAGALSEVSLLANGHKRSISDIGMTAAGIHVGECAARTLEAHPEHGRLRLCGSRGDRLSSIWLFRSEPETLASRPHGPRHGGERQTTGARSLRNKGIGHPHRMDVPINLRRIDPPTPSLFDIRNKCRGGKNSHGYTTAIAWSGRRRSVGFPKAFLGTNDHRSRAARWPRCAADHHHLSTERANDPAADSRHRR